MMMKKLILPSLAILVILAAWLPSGLAQQLPQQPQTGPQEESVPEEAQQQEWTKKFQQAENLFNSTDQASSIPIFQDLVATLTEAKIKTGLNDPEQAMLYRSLDYLAQAFYLDGRMDEARQVFLKLVELNPNYQLNEQLVSKKILEFVNQIKAQNLGVLSITSQPPGADVKLDGVAVGKTDLAQLYSLKGEHDLEVSKPGFYPHKETISVTPHKQHKIKVELERSSSVAYFITYPAGVEILMSRKKLGVSAGPAADRAQAKASELNLPGQDFSAEFSVPDLQPGAYELEFRKPCWETAYRKITIDKNDDYQYEPIVLAPSHGYLDVTADDEKAVIFVDDEYIGSAPRPKIDVCSGKHVLKLKGPRGKFEKQIEVKKDQVLPVAARLNPSLAYLGLITEAGVQKADADRLSAEIKKQLNGLQNLNFVDDADYGATKGDNLRDIIEGVKSNKPAKERSAVIQEISNKVESDLMLVGYVPRETLQRTVVFYILSSWSSMADVRRLQVTDLQQWNTFRSQLEYEEPLFQRRLGVYLIDTALTPGPVVAQVMLQANEQALNKGDIILAVDGKALKSAADVNDEIAANKQDTANITVLRAGVQSSIPVKLTLSPREIQFSNPDLIFNRQMVAFKKAINLSNNPLEKNIAMLNIGLCYMHFAEYDLAFDQLRQVQLDRPVGIGQGTVQYRIAQCYRELNYRKEAQDSLQEAAKYSKNTILFDDGPSLAREIERASLSLQ